MNVMNETIFSDENAYPSMSPTVSPIYNDDSEVLRITLRIYGSGAIVLLFIFCHVRREYPLLYNIRSWSSMPGMKTKLSKDQFGFFSWVYHVWKVSDDDMLQECGMDAISYLRAPNFWFRICLVGMFNSLWLLPTYATGEINISDAIANLTINNLPDGSQRFIGTIVAAYIFFGATLWLLEREFQWFTDKRHKFLSEFNARNYTCFVRNIPSEFRDNDKLQDFFGNVFGRENILEVHVDLEVPGLEQKCKQRDNALKKLEHAIALKNMYDKEKFIYRHSDNPYDTLWAGVKVPALVAYNQDVVQLHASVLKGIDRLERKRVYYAKKKAQKTKSNVSDVTTVTAPLTRAISFTFDDSQHGNLAESKHEDRLAALCEASKESFCAVDNSEQKEEETTKEVEIIMNGMMHNPLLTRNRSGSTYPKSEDGKSECGSKKSDCTLFGSSGRWYSAVTKMAGFPIITAPSTQDSLGEVPTEPPAKDTSELRAFKFDGKPKNAAFVTFTRMSACQAARQLVQHHTPHVMSITAAPDPREIFWENVGWTHKQYELGQLLVLFLSACLLVAWTFPTALISSFGDLDELQSVFPLLREWLESLPSLQGILAQLAPVFLIALNVWVLPEILRAVCLMEGHISDSSLEASVFFKVSVFAIVQTFFVSTVAGTITSSVSEIRGNPERIFFIIAEALPLQSTYFLQFILVSTLFSVPWELLRVTYLFQAVGAANLGFHMTWKEKMKSKPLKMYSLEDPMEFQYRRIFSNDILYFVVLFTYGTMAPIITWFTAACLFVMIIAYKHNYMYNYSKTPDSGGLLWLMFIRLVQVSVLIGEFLLLGYLIIKKATVAWPFMIPIIVGTLLHTKYLRQKHFWVADSLPAERCLGVDMTYARDFSDFTDEYVRPILKPTELVIDFDHGKSDLRAKEKRRARSWKDRILNHADRFQIDDGSSAESVSLPAGNNDGFQDGFEIELPESESESPACL